MFPHSTHMVKLVMALSIIVLAAGFGACQKETVTKVVTPTPEAEAEATPAEPTRRPATPKPQPTPRIVVGDTLETNAGDRFSVYIYLRNFEGEEYFAPDPGREWVAFDVETCSGPNTDDLSANPFYWTLKLGDNTNAEMAFGGMEPRLSSSELFADDCVRGWVTFDIPAGAKLDSIRLDDFRHKAKWDIQ